MLLFTDGFTEALNSEDNEFGLDRLEEMWRENTLSPDEMVSLIVNETEAFAEGTNQFDDQTMLLVARPEKRGA